MGLALKIQDTKIAIWAPSWIGIQGQGHVAMTVNHLSGPFYGRPM